MKKLIFCLSVLFLVSSGCKKAIDKIGEDLIIKAMTDGKWAITQFTVNGGQNTFLDFAGYRFKYYSNKTVDVTRNGVLELTGTWDANTSSKMTWANLPGATFPLSQVNGAWHITKNSWSYVEANQTVNGDLRFMRLDKE